MYKRNLILTGLAVTASINVWSQQKTNHDRQNILFIVCDDLRPELGCYGRKQIKSPNIDRWATQSVLFDRAYCNIAVSGASRASLLTGLRPTKNLLQTWNARTDVDVPDAVTIQKCFRDAGYITIANGKIYHHQDEASMKYWDDVMPPVPGTAMGYHSDENLALMQKQQKTGKGRRGYFYEHGDFPEKDYLDTRKFSMRYFANLSCDSWIPITSGLSSRHIFRMGPLRASQVWAPVSSGASLRILDDIRRRKGSSFEIFP